MKQIVIALVDRLAAHAAREADSNEDDEEASEIPASPKEASKAEEPAEEKSEDEAKETNNEQLAGENEAGENEAGEDSGETTQEAKSVSTKPPKVRRIRGIPEDVKLFEIFWGKIVDLVKVMSGSGGTIVLIISLYCGCYTDIHPRCILLFSSVLTFRFRISQRSWYH